MKLIDNIAVATWTHSSYSDVWSIYYGQFEKYAPFFKHYMIVNEHTEAHPLERCTQIMNNENDLYHKRFTESMSQINEKYVLYMQEDFLLYDSVLKDNIVKIVDFLENSDHSFVRLINSGVIGVVENSSEKLLNNPDVYEIPNLVGNPPIVKNEFDYEFSRHHTVHPGGYRQRPYIFSYQAAIWKRESLINLFDTYKPKSLMEGELYGSYACFSTGVTGGFLYQGEPKRGNLHYDSYVFPYVATALHGGSHGKPASWAINEYPEILTNILKEHNVDPNIRGIV